MLNLERLPPLTAKLANQIGKTVKGFRAQWVLSGTEVQAGSLLDSDGKTILAEQWVPLQEWERRRALHNRPSDDDRKAQIVRKFELRLNKECKSPPVSGSETDIQAWLGSLVWYERKALLMSQKDFSKSYPDGFRPPQ